jgi:formamidopyrimidine-DNA glycosylase
MPELPDLEVMKERLSDAVVGRPLARVEALHPGILKTVSPSLDLLCGHSFRSIARRGKHLILSAETDLHAVIHLMLAGRLVLCRSETKTTKATAFRWGFEDGNDLRLIENASIHRARVHLVHRPEDVESVARAGIEPLSDAFTVDVLADKVRTSRRQLKKLLTDQSLMAGIGSAYADEILFHAKLSPVRYGTALDDDEIARLHESIRHVLRWAIEEVRAAAGGPTLIAHERSFVRVVKRTGQPCPDCGAKIAEIRYAQTKTYYCPQCQSSGRTIKDRRSWLTR